MQTVLLVLPMTLGEEVAVRDLHERFPVEALERGVGIERLVAFIGSGMYALEITVSEGDFQEQFHRFLGTPEVARFFDELRRYVQDLPTPTQETAEMQMAAPMLEWQRSRAGVAPPA